MGLDMYLTKKTYVQNWDHTPENERWSILVSRGDSMATSIRPERISYIVEDVAYWRKANAIHMWFVENVQEGVDDCKPYWVSVEQLQELLDVVTKVLSGSRLIEGKISNGTTYHPNGNIEEHYTDGRIIEDPSLAKELLPTQSGFFFGNTDYNEFYIEDLEYTQKTLADLLREDNGRGDFYYQSSW